jgi:predicted MPP superfamily phosphohydrolase
MESFVTIVVAGSTAIDALVLAAGLFLRPGRIGPARVAAALAATGGVAAVKALALVVFSGSFFLGICLAYVDTMVLLPLAGLVLLVAARRRAVARSVALLALASLTLAPIGAYATFVEPFRLVEERVAVRVRPERAGRDPLRVAVLADIQSRVVHEHLALAVARAMAFEPHLVLLPGDLIQAEPAEYDRVIDDFRELLRPLAAPLGVWFVLGNTDDPRRVRRVFEGTRVRVLDDDLVELEHGDRRIVLGGVSPFRRGLPPPLLYELENRPGDDLRILLAHYPDVALDLAPDTRVDLVVAGHTHGGQVQLPWFGPPITLSRVPRRVGAGGLHELGGRLVYVSRGLGCERGLAPRVRFLAPPEVSLLTFETR